MFHFLFIKPAYHFWFDPTFYPPSVLTDHYASSNNIINSFIVNTSSCGKVIYYIASKNIPWKSRPVSLPDMFFFFSFKLFKLVFAAIS